MKLVLLTLFLSANVALAGGENIVGYDQASTNAQRQLESKLDQSIDAKQMDQWLQRLSYEPHHLGSAADKKNAEFIAALFRSWGYDVNIEKYRVLMPTPKTRLLELTAPTKFRASLTEDSLPEDPSTSRRKHLLPPYNAFSTDGEAEAQLVFVNYGIPEDYEVLERNGIDVAGKIVIAKYGKSWRGIKPKLAAEKGAVAAIIYSDPADDGYGAGDVYPKGPFKNASGVQRGSVMDMPTYPGDVLTPGHGATAHARRLDRADAPTITKIPVLPISYRDALPLLKALGGSVVPPEWRGGLPITYHFGPGPARVHLKAEFNWDMVTAYDVIARLEGSRYPDEWVIRGNHYDAWNDGAEDPLSGQVAMLAEARAVAKLAESGHAPLRTMIYAAWDGEEPGLIGSTEWVEEHAAELMQHAVAYINTDGNDRGFITIGGSHSLERFFNQIIDDVDDPRQAISLKQRARARALVFAADDKTRAEASERADLRLKPLGSGSDYTPFLQHLGIASANLYFDGEGDNGSYHTLYDTYELFTTWTDPDLVYGATLARVTGRAALRLANAPRLPFEFKGLAENIAKYVAELQTLADDMRKQTLETNTLIRNGTYAAALNPYKTLAPPPAQPAVPHFDFAPLLNALDRLQQAAAAFDVNVQLPEGQAAEINHLLFTSERLLTRAEGLEGRGWYKHYIYAPGFYTGYGVKTIPGVREAIEQRKYDQVNPQIELAALVLTRMAERIELINRKVSAL
jgi:N-acetylated-alpha-linked acidic dipeptidase